VVDAASGGDHARRRHRPSEIRHGANARGTTPLKLAWQTIPDAAGLVERALRIHGASAYEYGGARRAGRPIRACSRRPIALYIPPPSSISRSITKRSPVSVRGSVRGIVVSTTASNGGMRELRDGIRATNPAASARRAGWSTRGSKSSNRIYRGVEGERNVLLLEELCEDMVQGSSVRWAAWRR